MPSPVWSCLPGFALAAPLGAYLLPVYRGEPTLLTPLLRPVETALYRLAGVDPAAPMSVRTYVGAAAIFAAMVGLVSIAWPGSAAIVIRNASGSAIVMALVMMTLRRMPRQKAGNFWADLVRGQLYVLLPLWGLALLLLATAGAADALDAYARVHMHDANLALPCPGHEAARLVAALEAGKETSLPTLQWLAMLSHTLIPLALLVALVVSFPSSRQGCPDKAAA